MSEIMKVNTIADYYEWMGSKPIHPLVAVIDYANTPPLVPNRKLYGFYAIFLKDQKCGELKYGRQYYDYQNGTLLFVSPGQVYGSDSVNVPIQGSGYALLFHPDLFHGTQLSKCMKDYTFFAYESNEALHLSVTERQVMTDCLNRITFELENPEDRHSKKLIAGAIKMFLDYCVRFYERQFSTRSVANHDTLTRLENLLDDYINSGKAKERGFPTVRYCADELNISPNYLSDLMRKETGNSVLTYIHSKLIERAKTELTSSNATINEVAYALGFEYAHHFTRLFKKIEGCTPTEYRKQVL